LPNTGTTSETPASKMTKANQSPSWMNAAAIESRLIKADPEETAAMAEAIARVRERVADQIVRHRNEEAADFADAQHQIVGYETR